MITKPQNVFVARDIACGGYVAGGNCKFFAEDPGVGFSKAVLTKNLQDRLGFANDDGKAYGSLLAFPLPKSQYESGQMDTVMSISSRMLPWDMSTSNSSFPGGELFHNKYAKANVGLNTIHYGEDTRAAENMEYVSQGSVNNALCFIGPHRKWNTWSASHIELVPGQGHFGPDAVPGVSLHEWSPPPPPCPSRFCFKCVSGRTGRSLAAGRSRVAQGGAGSHEDLRSGCSRCHEL